MVKKNVMIIIILLILLLILGFFCRKNDSSNKDINLDKDEFIINKVNFYTNANAINNSTNYQNPEWNLNIYQYTDIAIYIDRLNNVSENNYISELSIHSININSLNEIVYYLNPIEFGNSKLDETKILEDNCLKYTVINSNNEKNDQTYNIPIYFQDCSNPITFRIVNKLAENYKIKNNDLKFNGSLIGLLDLKLEDLRNSVDFYLRITTKDGKIREKKIYLNIPLKDETKSILDGDYEIEVNENIKF